jgi:hypothetical protein
VAQLMSSDGLLLDSSGEQQQISVRVAGEFLSSGEQLTGLWSKKAYVLQLQPGCLLLSCQPRHSVKEALPRRQRGCQQGLQGLVQQLYRRCHQCCPR